jgi:hypothetical protein
VMPADLAAQFRQSALERGYSRIYREHPVQRLFKETRNIEGLDPAVLQSIVQLEGSFLGELSGMNRQLRNNLREHEPNEHAGRADDFAKRMAGQNVEPKTDPTRELFLKRDDMCRGYAKQLQTLLTPEQFAQLPGAMRWVEVPESQAQAVPAEPSPKHKARERVSPTDTTSPSKEGRDGTVENQ